LGGCTFHKRVASFNSIEAILDVNGIVTQIGIPGETD
jgi:hypothetical protein